MTATVREAKAGFADQPTWGDGALVFLIGLLVLQLRFLGALLSLIGEFSRETAVLATGFILDSADRAEAVAVQRGVRRRAAYAHFAEDPDLTEEEPTRRRQNTSFGAGLRSDSGSRPGSETATSTDTLAGVAS